MILEERATMRLETLPLIAGALIALLGLGVILDASLSDYTLVPRERRRRPRRERDRAGEVMIGLGLLGMAGAFLGRDVWQYRIVSAIAGALFLLVGLVRNRGYLGEVLGTRGPGRRANPPMGERGATPAAPLSLGDEIPKDPRDHHPRREEERPPRPRG
jgi:hypothetical protein